MYFYDCSNDAEIMYHKYEKGNFNHFSTGLVTLTSSTIDMRNVFSKIVFCKWPCATDFRNQECKKYYFNQFSHSWCTGFWYQDMKNDISTFLFNWPGDTRFRYYRYKKMLFQLFSLTGLVTLVSGTTDMKNIISTFFSNWPGDAAFRHQRCEKCYFNHFSLTGLVTVSSTSITTRNGISVQKEKRANSFYPIISFLMSAAELPQEGRM